VGGTARTPLEQAVRGEVRRDRPTLEGVSGDASHLTGRPSAVVRPVDDDDIVALVRWARTESVPLVPRGAGTSLDGESVPADGAVVVDLTGWNRVLELATDERWARVGPGIGNFALQEAVRPHGLFFPPNPGSWHRSTVGGNVATNASGPRSFRYGAARSWVRALAVVFGNGARARLGTRSAKRSLGPDLLSLVVGSEGTLAIVTEVTVRLAPLPAVRRGLVVPVGATVGTGAIAARLAGAALEGLSAVEYVDRATSRALADEGAPLGPADSAWLLLEVEGPTAAEAERRAARVVAELAASGVTAPPQPFDDADEMWTRRGESGSALDRRLGPRVREDVAVPVGRTDELLAELERAAAEERVPLYVYGHLGEGSVHPNFAVDPASPVAARLRERTVRAALALGGTISGEHGIGRLKRPFVEEELGPAAVGLLDAVKRWCDPDGILNPGKLYPTPRGGGRSAPSPSGAATP